MIGSCASKGTGKEPSLLQVEARTDGHKVVVAFLREQASWKMTQGHVGEQPEQVALALAFSFIF